MFLEDLKESLKAQQKINEYDLERLSQTHDINLINLKKLARDLSIQTPNSYSDAISIVSYELRNGLNFNQIIIKYGIDKNLV